ncbi:MAG: hypothetical protein M0T74_12735, partial [Desulfitobacterium hafniense]|nr:hypothetical protein [Desulfitobacterium hafniense]
ARIAQTFDVAIRDNQTSDGSLSMALVKPGVQESQLLKNLRVLMENGYSDVKYLCISSAYVQVPSSTLKVLSEFPQLVINLTVSGWHSIEENLLRLNEFERYLSVLDNTYLRVVNREDWAGIGSAVSDSGARSEEWLLGEIERRGLSSKVIRTPFHSVHKFPGSSPGNLGSRHMADISYNETVWNDIFDAGGRECCVTGKCKSCTTRCGAPGELWAPDWEIVSQAYLAMYHFELKRQSTFGRSPLAIYTARLIARKAMTAFEQSGNFEKTNYCKTQYEQLNDELSGMSLTQIQRRRFANDSHAIVMDGVDRHSLWGNAKAI